MVQRKCFTTTEGLKIMLYQIKNPYTGDFQGFS